MTENTIEPYHKTLVRQAFNAMRFHRFTLDNEKRMQAEIYEVLDAAVSLAQVEREVDLLGDRQHIIDFMVGTVGIEVKLKYPKRKIYRQLERYAKTGKLQAIILVSVTAIGLPEQIEGVDIYVLNPAKAWL